MLTALKSLRLRAQGDLLVAVDHEADAAQATAADRSSQSVILWLPLALATGIFLYFSLPREPTAWSAWLLLALALLLFSRWKYQAAMLLLAGVLAGFALAKLRADAVATPLLTARTGELVIVGVIEQVSVRTPARMTIVIAAEQIESLAPDQTPRRLRLSVYKGGDAVAVGNRVSMRARLAPLPGPAMPGGFDFGRQLYFEGIGGTGRVVGDVRLLEQEHSLNISVLRALDGLRSTIDARIAASLPEEEASVAAALITGDRAQIPKETTTSLQVSGLAHILSISGLHMSLAAGGIFWLVRALLALSPMLALNFPIKKWAAVTAMAGGFLYMLLAGAGAATQRSYIMVAIMLFAILVDRSAISLRNLAVAAIVILIVEPESAVEASFQMSFMAVMGLASFFEWWNSRSANERTIAHGLLVRTLRWITLAITASLLTSLIAGSLSSIPAAFHFGRAAPYGVLANGLAIPVISIVVMPAALASVIAMPFGLERWPLELMGFGLNRVLAISNWVAELPGSSLVLPQISEPVALLLAVSAAVLCLAPRRYKAWCLPLLAISFLATGMSSPPDMLIERTAANVAFRNERGELVFAVPRKGSFAAGRWLQANGEKAGLAEAAKRQGWNCASGVCRATVEGKRVVYLATEDAALPDCAATEILISASPLRGRCRAVPVRIDRFDVWRHGAHAVQIDQGELSVATASGLAGQRPWVVVPTARVRTK